MRTGYYGRNNVPKSTLVQTCSSVNTQMNFKEVNDIVHDVGMDKPLYSSCALPMLTNFQHHPTSLKWKSVFTVSYLTPNFSHPSLFLASIHSNPATLASLCFLRLGPQRFVLGVPSLSWPMWLLQWPLCKTATLPNKQGLWMLITTRLAYKKWKGANHMKSKSPQWWYEITFNSNKKVKMQTLKRNEAEWMAHVIQDSQETEKGGPRGARNTVPVLMTEQTLSQNTK